MCFVALKIHVSPQTKEVLDTFGTFDLELRGEIEMKVSGKLFTIFWYITRRGLVVVVVLLVLPSAILNGCILPLAPPTRNRNYTVTDFTDAGTTPTTTAERARAIADVWN